jgi:ABC-type dipeptide/oligopeptide/nickel transport system permease subunit
MRSSIRAFAMDEQRAEEIARRSAFRETVRRLVRTRSARAAIALLLCFHAAAIFAPLIANDRPYVLEAIDFGRYESACKSLAPVTRSLAALVEEGEAHYLARRAPASAQTWAEAIERERSALRLRADTLRHYLKASDEALVDRFEAAIDTGLRAPAAAAAPFDAAIALAGKIESDLAAIDPRAPATGRVELESQRSHPLLAALSAVDVFLMMLTVCGIFALALNAIAGRRARTSRWRIQCAASVIVALSLALAWRPLFGRDDVLANAAIKEGIRTGDIRVERALFPPIAMGYAETNLSEAFRPPTWTSASRPGSVRVGAFEPALDSAWRHLLGTDSLGRDVLARLLWGARISLSVGLLSALLLTAIGTTVGLLAGWFGGRIDFVISRTIEVVLCFPAFVLVLCAVFFIDPRVVSPILAVALVIGFVGWPGVARLVRAECSKLRELEFVAAARALGLSTPAILARHVLPNAIGPVIVAFSFAVGGGMLTESALSFLGFGVESPVASWGSLVGDSKTPDHWWIWLAPGVCIFATVVAYNLAGDALRDALDPRRREG